MWSQRLLLADKNTYKKRTRVRLPLPALLLSLPDKDHNVLGHTVHLRTWIANIDTWAEDEREVYVYARNRAWIEIIGPWTPTSKFMEMTMCVSWSVWALSWQQPRFPQCPARQDVIDKGYSFRMRSERCGIAIKDPDYLSQVENTVSLSLWVMLTRSCSGGECSLVYRFDNAGNLHTPLITIDNKQRVHITVYFGEGEPGRVATLDKPLPLNKWARLGVSIGAGGTLVGCVGNNPCQFWTFNQPIVYDENAGLWLMGGNVYLPGAAGYFGRLQLHRDTFYGVEDLTGALGTPPKDHPMWNTKEGYQKCVTFE